MEDKVGLTDLNSREGIGFRKPGLAQVCLLYSAVILLFLMVGYRIQGKEFYSGILITEFLLVMGPPLLFMILGKFDLKKVLRLNKISFLNLFLIVCIMLFAIPLAGVFNLVNLWIVNSVFGKIVLPQIPTAGTWGEMVINVLVIGGSAGLCEEFAFRGTIQRGFERFGATKSIIITAFLFGLMHLDFQRLFGTFLLGALIGFIVYRTNSLYGGMLAHFTNNSAAVVIGFISNKFLEFMKQSGANMPETQNPENIFSTFQNMPKEQILIAVVVWGFILFFFAASFIALLYAFTRTTKGKSENLRQSAEVMKDNGGSKGLVGLLGLLPAVVLISTIYIVEALRFRGIDTGFVKTVLQILGV